MYINCHPTNGALQVGIRIKRHLFVSSVSSLEVQHGGPIVGEVLGEETCCAISFIAEYSGRVHGRVESVSTHNLMRMR